MSKTDYKFTELGGASMKAINFDAFGGFEAYLRATSNGNNGDQAQQLRRVVPWLAKATDMTALAVSELPFDILTESGDVYDTSDDWKNRIGGMPSPADVLYKLASSLCLGRAYLIPNTITRAIVSLQYCAPQTVTPNITTSGITNFQRTTAQGQSSVYYPVEAETDPAMMYFWLPDSDVEIGPAESYPASTALLSAQMLVSMDSTISTIAGRGFISPTVLMAKGMTNKDERATAETWWNRFLRGWTATVAKILNGEAMSIMKIGAAMEELRGIYPELSKQAIENIGTAFGIPAALFMSDMAFASEVDPLIRVWYSTSQFVKIYRCIETTFSTQLLNRWKLKMKFRPESLPAFQTDEKATADLYGVLLKNGIKPSWAAQMANLKLPEGVKPEDLDEPEEPEPQPVTAGQNATDTEDDPEDEPVTLTAEMTKDLDLWRQVSVRRYRKGAGRARDFECKQLPDSIADGIRARLDMAKTEAEIVKAFEVGVAATMADPVLAELRRANDLLTKAMEV